MSNDAVNHPTHYTRGGIECIDVLQAKFSEEAFKGFCVGNAIKYLMRAGHKNNECEDYRKAVWYLNRQISTMEKVPELGVQAPVVDTTMKLDDGSSV